MTLAKNQSFAKVEGITDTDSFIIPKILSISFLISFPHLIEVSPYRYWHQRTPVYFQQREIRNMFTLSWWLDSA